MTLTPKDQARYRALAERIEADDLSPLPDAARLASAEDDADLDAALDATDTSGVDTTLPTPDAPADAVHANSVRRGRPRLGEAVENITWRVRATKQLDAVVTEHAVRTGKTRSDVIREAVAEYARAHEVPA